LHASYLHLHWAGYPEIAQRFANAVHDHTRTLDRPVHDLGHHGDRDATEGLIDLAVNVRLPAPPDWLSTIINQTTKDLAAYPNTDAAAKAIAAAHDVAVDHVLPSAGGAEAFTLLARALRATRPLIIHPQFTEPEAALIAAGHRPERLILSTATRCLRRPILS
jgi:cobyrinic acid a,c-diamide synthase